MQIFKGYNGNVLVGDTGIKITRGVKGALLTFSLRGEKSIPYSSITSVQYKKAGILSGFIQFSIRGGGEAKAGQNEATLDENSVTFQFTSNEKFKKLQKIIEAKLIEREQSQGNESHHDRMLALEKLHELKNKGVISEQEFETEKKELLEQ